MADRTQYRLGDDRSGVSKAGLALLARLREATAKPTDDYGSLGEAIGSVEAAVAGVIGAFSGKKLETRLGDATLFSAQQATDIVDDTLHIARIGIGDEPALFAMLLRQDFRMVLAALTSSAADVRADDPDEPLSPAEQRLFMLLARRIGAATLSALNIPIDVGDQVPEIGARQLATAISKTEYLSINLNISHDETPAKITVLAPIRFLEPGGLPNRTAANAHRQQQSAWQQTMRRKIAEVTVPLRLNWPISICRSKGLPGSLPATASTPISPAGTSVSSMKPTAVCFGPTSNWTGKTSSCVSPKPLNPPGGRDGVEFVADRGACTDGVVITLAALVAYQVSRSITRLDKRLLLILQIQHKNLEIQQQLNRRMNSYRDCLHDIRLRQHKGFEHQKVLISSLNRQIRNLQELLGANGLLGRTAAPGTGGSKKPQQKSNGADAGKRAPQPEQHVTRPSTPARPHDRAGVVPLNRYVAGSGRAPERTADKTEKIARLSSLFAQEDGQTALRAPTAIRRASNG